MGKPTQARRIARRRVTMRFGLTTAQYKRYLRFRREGYEQTIAVKKATA